MISLQQRDRQPEVMDQSGLDKRLHHQALAGLRRSNLVSNTVGALWRGLVDSGILALGIKPLRILDVACGGGDNVIRLGQLAAKRGIAVDVHGCDISAAAIEYATHAVRRSRITDAHFFQSNVLIDPLPRVYDLILCTLFLHHLDESDAGRLLERMASATRHTVLVDDLIRTRLGYALVVAGTRLLTSSRVVRVDGPLSVRAAFTMEEVRDLAERSGLHGARFRRHWPERFLLTWNKP